MISWLYWSQVNLFRTSICSYVSVHLYVICLKSWIQKENPSTVVVDDDNKDAVEEIKLTKENKTSASGSMSKRKSQFASTTSSKEVSANNCGSLVQATISTLFKKVEEKVHLLKKNVRTLCMRCMLYYLFTASIFLADLRLVFLVCKFLLLHYVRNPPIFSRSCRFLPCLKWQCIGWVSGNPLCCVWMK